MEMMKRYLSMPGRKYDYCIVTDCPDLINVLEICYCGLIKCEPVRECVDLYVYQISEGEYKGSFHGKTSIYKDPIRFVKGILFEYPFFTEDILALHGSAIAVNNKAFLFLGSTGKGKTTLAAYLVISGYKYITEDCILADYRKGTIAPCLRPFHLREGGMKVLEQNNISLEYRHVDYFSFNKYVYMPQNVATLPTQIGGIFFIERSEERNAVYPISPEDAFFRLIKSTITQYPLRSPYIQGFKKLSKVPCFKVEYADFSFVKEVVENKARVC